MGTQLPSGKGGGAPNFRQMSIVVRLDAPGMPLGMEVGLSPGGFVLDGTQLPSQKGGEAPQIFGPIDPCLLWPNGRMYQDTTRYGGRPQSRRHCVRWGLSSPSPKGA